MRLAERIRHVELSPTFRINAIARRMKAAGIGVLDFSVGEHPVTRKDRAVRGRLLVGEHDELPADAKQADDLGPELLQSIGRDEVEHLPGQHEIERARRVIELERTERGGRLTRLPLRGGFGKLDLVDVHARPAAGEEHDALAAQRAQHENLRLTVAERARDRPAEPAARLTGDGRTGSNRGTRT